MRHVNGPIFVVAALLLGGLLLTTGGCNDAGTLSDDPVYRVDGVMVANVNSDSTHVIIEVLRDSVDVDTAVVQLGATCICYIPPITGTGQYVLSRDSVLRYANDSLLLTIHETDFGQTIPVLVPDTFSVTTVFPATRISNGAQPVQIEWTATPDVDGYIVAAVPTAVSAPAYTFYATSQATSATFPVEAFYPSGGPNPDTGMYELHVYGYNGSPDSSIAADMLPSLLPSQLDDNLDAIDFSGRFGVIMVARYDSVWVQVL